MITSGDDKDWYDNFRMTKDVFELVNIKAAEYLKPKQKCVCLPFDTRKKVALCLYWLASTAEYRTVANLFGVGKTTVFDCIHDVCSALEDVLLDEYVVFPENEDLRDVIQGFEKKWNFPNCVGAIDRLPHSHHWSTRVSRGLPKSERVVLSYTSRSM